MKIPKNQIRSRKRLAASINFATQHLTSYGGLIIFQHSFNEINLTNQLKSACSSLARKQNRQYHHGTLVLTMIVHMLIGFRKLRDSDYYREDPMIKEILNLKRLPSVPTMSRMLSEFDESSVNNLHDLNTQLVLNRLAKEKLYRVTIDIDGTVLSTRRHAEGSAVGFNKKKKGDLSYYPLFATIAQTAQQLAFMHRPGNLHDSNGAVEFVRYCIEMVRKALPKAIIEVRMDSAFNTEAIIDMLDAANVEYTLSVPFERLAELKGKIESRKRWRKTKSHKGVKIGYFEEVWKPKSWSSKKRYIFVRTPTKKQHKGPIQLDLFEPHDFENRYKVIVTNKKTSAAKVIAFHEGRGTQEKHFGEGKSQLAMDYIPCRKKLANETYLLCSTMAYNLNLELQMECLNRDRKTSPQRSSLWKFEEMNTIRNGVIRTAGKLTRPQGKLTLTLPDSRKLRKSLRDLLPEPAF